MRADVKVRGGKWYYEVKLHTYGKVFTAYVATCAVCVRVACACYGVYVWCVMGIWCDVWIWYVFICVCVRCVRVVYVVTNVMCYGCFLLPVFDR